MNTNWSSPKRNIIAGLNSLRKALQAGMKARLVRKRNEDCDHPIRVKQDDTDFRNFEFQIGYAASRNSIAANPNMTAFQKYLSLNYVTCYGTPEAVERYYKTGLMSADNHKGIGTSHLVKAEDLIMFLLATGDNRAELYKRQYTNDGNGSDDVMHMYNFYRYKHGSPWAVKTFKRKLWVVELLKDGDETPRTPVAVHVMNALMYPVKFIPRRDVLKMDRYTLVTYRVGDVTNGLSIEFHLPKKFSFN